MPIVTQYNVTSQNSHQSGLSDAVISAFLSPSQTKNGVTWGAGPVFLVPTATDDLLGGKKWGIGPTAVGLLQTNGMTFGALVNQIWSFAGNKERPDINQLFVQPFFTYNWKSGAGLGAVVEMTENWATDTNVTFLILTASGLTRFGKLPVQLTVGPRIPISGPNKPDFGWRAAAVLLLPK